MLFLYETRDGREWGGGEGRVPLTIAGTGKGKGGGDDCYAHFILGPHLSLPLRKREKKKRKKKRGSTTLSKFLEERVVVAHFLPYARRAPEKGRKGRGEESFCRKISGKRHEIPSSLADRRAYSL